MIKILSEKKPKLPCEKVITTGLSYQLKLDTLFYIRIDTAVSSKGFLYLYREFRVGYDNEVLFKIDKDEVVFKASNIYNNCYIE